MKTCLLALCAALAFAGSAGTVRADDVAVLHFRSAGQLKRVVFEFYPQAAPVTVENFKKLACSHFYNGTAVHRIFPGQMVQMGDPLSRKAGNPAIGTGGPGYTLPLEPRCKHIAGAVAAARLPDRINPARRSNGSQFYITLNPSPSLDGQYTVFGRVIEGLDALESISRGDTDTNDAPVTRVVLESVQIVPREAATQGDPKPGRVGKLFRRLF